MNIQDFSNNFDVLLNSYAIAAGFGSTDNPTSIELDEYEKSVFLTKGQEDVVIGLYSGRNSMGTSFEETEELRRYLSPLVSEASLSPTENTTGILGMGSKSRFFTLPEDLWFITYEAATTASGERCEGMDAMDVVPVTQDEYHKIKRNPFRGANLRRALRLDLSEGVVEIVCNYTIDKYYVRYLKKPKPIVLIPLTGDLNINGVTTVTPCELHEAVHQKILERAVQLALESRGVVASPQSARQKNS